MRKRKEEQRRFKPGLGSKGIEPSADLVELAIPMIIELTLVATCKISERDLLHAVLDKALEEMRGLFGENEFQLFSRGGEVRPATEEEVQDLLPRKMHLRDQDDPHKWVCDTRHVSQKNITDDKDKVTCKLCCRWIEHLPEKGPEP